MPRFIRVIAPAVLLAATFAALFWGLSIGGAANERDLADPGALVRYGVPILRTLVNVSVAGLVGSLVMAVWAFAVDKPEYRIAMDVAAGAAAVLTVASGATLILTYSDITTMPFSGSAAFGAGLAQFVTEVEIGQLWLWELLIAALVTVFAFAVRGRRMTLLVLVLGLLTTLPLAQQGHAAGASGHSQAVNSLLVHLVGAAVWLGGLLVLIFVAKSVNRERLAILVSRYSSIALLAFIAVSASGVVSAWLRIGDLDALFGTGYGQLIILKTVSLVALGAFGALHRQRLIPRIEQSDRGMRVFAWFVVAELAVMGLASGIAGALGRTATPVPLEPAGEAVGASPAEILTGDPLPPELTPMSYLTEWKFDLAWGLVAFFGIAFYIAGVLRLRRRGDSWPIGRTIAWTAGMLFLFYATNGAFNAYEQYLFSVHMLGHMMFTMLIPLVLVLGAPVTLALRATDKRTDGSWGTREWIMWGLQTPWSKIVTNPVVAAAIFVGSLWVFYFSPILRWAMAEHLGHQWMIIHFLISGYLFSLTMIGVDPIPNRAPYPIRLVILFATMASHAFFGVTMMTGDSLFVADWFGSMGRTWGATPLEDQATGGGIAWGIGELPTLALALVVAVQWSRSDTKEQKRKDRAEERSGDSELEAYNAMLAAQAERDTARAARSESRR
ncbi:cytochrome c oxidase assembly protein [Leucobacter aridicollis]|uniref:Putative copper resistance protein D n=1 Tax=Leucobacter aridicollis TaxID=283878 RepID=A0A852RHG6_9MICO|nr:cytochrome c oxidase assembly protein [Leucobacter aridicollis]NYD28290.1 putative copper resistance protein D [Leucobacter aridicollis]